MNAIHTRLSRTLSWSAVALLPLAGCGGGAGGGGGGGGSGGTPPTAAIAGPANGVLAIRGDVVRMTITADDDGATSVRVLADVDGILATTGDQTVLFGPVNDNGGVPLLVSLSTTALAPGAYSIFLTVDDGFNPVASALYGPVFVVMAGRAGVAPNRSATYGVVGSLLVIAVGEAEDFNVVLNGDADVGDGVVGTLNATTGVFIQTVTSTDVTGVDAAGTARILEPVAGVAFFATRELDQGMINGDGDATDVMTSFLLGGGPTIVTHPFGGVAPLALVPPFGSRAVCSLVEAQEGPGGTNQNPGAGDADTLDTVGALVDSASNTLIRFPFAAGPPLGVKTRGNVGAYLAAEANQGADMNADADMVDTLLVLADLASPGPIGVLLGHSGVAAGHGGRHLQPGAAFAVSADQHTITYVSEPALGVSLNGDLDATDYVPSVYNAALLAEFFPVGGGVGNLNGGHNARHAFYEGSKAFYTAIEDPLHSPPAAGDNGDNDLVDQEILRWTDHAVNPALATTLAPGLPGFPGLTGLALDGGALAEVTPGWLSVVVSEAANGNLDLSGEGTIGFALLLIDATTNPPTVWNTGLAPSATAFPGTIPLTGVGDASGLVVNVLELNNGDLNLDMDATDQLLFYLPLAAPNAPVNLLNTAAVHAKVLGARVAITANENVAGSARDYNADGDTLDFVFRVVSTAGVLEEAGLACAATSRPAADDGSLWAYLRSEVAEARDLNGDGDQLDFVVGAWRP